MSFEGQILYQYKRLAIRFIADSADGFDPSVLVSAIGLELYTSNT